MGNSHKYYGPYERFFKRPFDFCCGLLAILVFWWLYLIVAVLVRIKLGSPVLFVQERPGKDEKIFKLYKFRSMTNKKDENGNLLPDEIRLTKFGKLLRATSLDELPEAFNLINGTISVCGPRPLLVRDMLFMSDEQRKRHTVRPGITGLAQVSGRNAILWETKLSKDLEYIEKISFCTDIQIIFKTIFKVFKREGICEEGMATAMDLGDYLLQSGKIGICEYEKKQEDAKNILDNVAPQTVGLALKKH